MSFYIELYLLVATILLAAKDGQSVLLKGNNNNSLTSIRTTKWHAYGVLLAFWFTLPGMYVYLRSWWQILIVSALIRLFVYDITFNDSANLPLSYIGTTADTDNFFVKIFGPNGEIKKSIVFFSIYILFHVSKIVFHF